MIFIYLIFFLVIMHVLGKQFTARMKLAEVKHPLVYGTVLYIGLGYAITFLLSVLHVSWNIFYMSLMAYNIAIIGVLIYFLFFATPKIQFELSFTKVKETLKNNWVVYTVIVAFVLLYFMSGNGTFYKHNGESLAGIDDYVYSMVSMKNVGVDHLLTSRNGVDFSIFNTSSIWNGFYAEILHQDIFLFTRVFLSILTYILVFFGIDEVLHLFYKEKYDKVKYAMLSLFLMYLPLGYASEVSKFMFYPWFGNVQVTMFMIPMLLILLYHVQYRFSMFYYYVIVAVYFFGNSLGGILYLVVGTPILLWGWYIKGSSMPRFIKLSRRNFALLFSLLTILLLMMYMFVNIKTFNIPVLRSYKHLGFVTEQSELSYSLAILRNKAIFMSIGIYIYLYRLFQKKTSKIENIFMGSLISAFVISIFPGTSNLFHNLLQFALRRFLESVSWVIIVYGFIHLYMNIKRHVLIKVVMLNILGVLILKQTIAFYIQVQKSSFSISNIQQVRKLSPTAEKVYHFFAEMKEDTYVCLVTSSALYLTDQSFNKETSENEYIYYSLAVSGTKNAHIVGCKEGNSKVNYLIVPLYLKEKYQTELNLSDSQIVQQYNGEAHDTSIIIYKVSGLPAISYYDKI